MGSRLRRRAPVAFVAMDTKRLSALPGLQALSRRIRRVQRKVYERPDGVARRLRAHTSWPLSSHLPQLLLPGDEMAVFRYPLSTVENNHPYMDLMRGLHEHPRRIPSKYF